MNASVMEKRKTFAAVPVAEVYFDAETLGSLYVSQKSKSFRRSQTAAQRNELKYVLDGVTYDLFRTLTKSRLESDSFACAHVCSLYLDTCENALIRHSLEKPTFKEKLRFRTYVPDPSPDDICFLEIKKKMDGVVYKRRVSMTVVEALDFCKNGDFPSGSLAALSPEKREMAIQILREIEWMYFHQEEILQPTFMISCERLSLKERNTDSLRITFDRDLRWSYKDGRVIPGIAGNALIDSEARIMEIKSTKGFPFWLIDVLNKLEVYPQSFSKVGKSYEAWLKTKGK